METFSHSRLSTFEQCRLKFRFQYIERIPVSFRGIEAFMGSVVHEVLEKLYREVLQGRTPPFPEILGDYEERWRRGWGDDVRIVKKRYRAVNYLNKGKRFLRAYYRNHHPFSQGEILGLETEDTLDLGEGYGFHIRIDRLMGEGEGLYSVNDYKTGGFLPSQEALDCDRQLAMYSLWVREHYPDAARVRLVWHYLAFDRHLTSERSPAELQSLKESVLEKIEEIQSCRSFPPKVTKLCPWCDHGDHCPAVQGRTEGFS